MDSNEAVEAVHHAAALLGDLIWLEQDTARKISPIAEAVVNMFVIFSARRKLARRRRRTSEMPWRQSSRHCPLHRRCAEQ